jgi:hypothetical protein
MTEADDISRALGKLEGKMDMVIDILNKDGGRIAAIEKRVWWQTGVFAIIAAVGTRLGFGYINFH